MIGVTVQSIDGLQVYQGLVYEYNCEEVELSQPLNHNADKSGIMTMARETKITTGSFIQYLKGDKSC